MTDPCVTVCVVSYNSGEYVLETLESIKHQTYKNIELIISDDGSSDGTDRLCREWLQENESCFVRSKLLTVEKNTGVTANCNRALAETTGEWFKIIAADDILMPECVEKFVDFVGENPCAKVVFGNPITFQDSFADSKKIEEKLKFSNFFFRDSISAKKQYKMIVKIPQVGCAPASFINTSVLRNVGGFNPRFPMNEDTPLYILLTSKGYKLWHMNEYVVYRRIHKQSIMHQKDDDAILNKATVRYITGEWSIYIQENSNWFWAGMSRISQWLFMKVISTGNTKTSLKCRAINLFRRAISPYNWYLVYAVIMDKILEKLIR